MFAVIQAWNEYLFAYVLIKQNTKQTVTVWLDTFITTKGVDWGALMAASTLVALPIVILFAIIQRRVATGLTAGRGEGMTPDPCCDASVTARRRTRMSTEAQRARRRVLMPCFDGVDRAGVGAAPGVRRARRGLPVLPQHRHAGAGARADRRRCATLAPTS